MCQSGKGFRISILWPALNTDYIFKFFIDFDIRIWVVRVRRGVRTFTFFIALFCVLKHLNHFKAIRKYLITGLGPQHPLRRLPALTSAKSPSLTFFLSLPLVVHTWMFLKQNLSPSHILLGYIQVLHKLFWGRGWCLCNLGSWNKIFALNT